MVQSTSQIKTCNLNSGESPEFTCRLQSFLRTAGKTAILLNKKLKGPCRRIKRDKLSGSNSKIKRLLKDEKKLERTEKDPTGNNSTKEKSSEKNDSPLEIIEGREMSIQIASLPIPKMLYLYSISYTVYVIHECFPNKRPRARGF